MGKIAAKGRLPMGTCSRVSDVSSFLHCISSIVGLYTALRLHPHLRRSRSAHGRRRSLLCCGLLSCGLLRPRPPDAKGNPIDAIQKPCGYSKVTYSTVCSRQAVFGKNAETDSGRPRPVAAPRKALSFRAHCRRAYASSPISTYH